MKANQKGFGVVEIIIVVLVLVAMGGLGYWVYSQNNKIATSSTANTSAQSATNKSNQIPTTAEDAAAKLGDKLTSLASGRYTIEKLDGSVTKISISASQTVAVAAGDSVRYRSDIMGDSSAAGYTAYRAAIDNDLKTLNTYAKDTLGMTQVYTHTDTGSTADTFVSTVYKVGDSYLELEGGNGFFDLSWGK